MIRYITTIDMNEIGSTGLIPVGANGFILSGGILPGLAEYPLIVTIHTDVGDIRETSQFNCITGNGLYFFHDEKIYGIAINRPAPFFPLAFYLELYSVSNKSDTAKLL